MLNMMITILRLKQDKNLFSLLGMLNMIITILSPTARDNAISLLGMLNMMITIRKYKIQAFKYVC